MASGLTEIIAALNISELDTDVFPLLDLPDLVRNKVFRFLRVWELMDLRLVCQTTKKWVEESHMDEFVLTVKNHSQIEEITSSKTTSWSNVKILCDSEMHNQDWIQNPLYLRLLQKLAPSLSSLRFEEHRVHHTGFSTILSTCKALKRLEIGILDCKGWLQGCISDEHTMAASLKDLEHLSVDYLAWNEEAELELFQKIILLCKNLISLKAPHILMASLFHIGDTDDEDTDQKYLELVKRRLVDPIVDYLNKQTPNNPFRKLNAENLHHSEIFPVLANTCYEMNIRLLNVSEAFEGPATVTEISCAEAIESLNGFTSYLDFNRLINLKEIKLDTETSGDSAIGNECLGAELPSLKALNLCLPEDIDGSILKCLLQQPRPSVGSLRIEFEVEEPKLSNLFNTSQILSNFSNLCELSLVQWDGKDDDLTSLLRNLSLLQSLRLQKCPKITDNGLIDKDLSNPVLLNLKDLKKLWLDCCISDLLLREVISRMKLEEFFYSSQLVTSSGLQSLADGFHFADSIIIYEGSQPENCSDEFFEKILKRFKNLKRSPRFFE